MSTLSRHVIPPLVGQANDCGSLLLSPIYQWGEESGFLPHTCFPSGGYASLVYKHLLFEIFNTVAQES